MTGNFSIDSSPGRGLIIVLSGPSGVGKDTLINGLFEICPGIAKVVTYTTRKPRQGEVLGEDYCFVSVDEFQGMIDKGEFLEYAQVHLDYYGTPLSQTVENKEKGFDSLLKIDVQGGLEVKRKAPEAIMIFVAPPSFEELERRLRSRYTDSEEAIQKRFSDARNEIGHVKFYDYLVVNDEIEQAVDNLRCIIMAERSRVR